ncbi:DNA replication protein DnaD [Vulcanisaeta sp. JCM 16161]|uniref:DNA replication protein DnaD n=1 Tax=Vulcanisaeta sp. JCM 16161 TaxID=1295372 RepID=UPI001FB4480E|nr:DNA replication protein DnaD [Vulcanisaeta sp. JCM 16161]
MTLKMGIYLILDEQTGLLLFLFFLVLLAWKPETLPRIARELGKWYYWARKSLEDFMREINEPIYEARNTVNNTVMDIRRTVNEALDPDILRIARALA